MHDCGLIHRLKFSLTAAVPVVWLLVPVPVLAQPIDRVNGDLITFQPDGAWSWYTDERVIVSGGQIILGSVAAKVEGDLPGYTLTPRDPGDIIATTFNLANGQRSYFELNDQIRNNDGIGAGFEVDDHNAPALLALPDGNILAVYTGHSEDGYIRSRKTINPGDTSAWTPEQQFIRTDAGISGENDVTYSNLHYVPNEGTGQGRVYNFFRNELANSWDNHFVYSDNLGDSWQYGGQLTGQNTARVRPYTKFADNGNGRIYFTTTEDNGGDNIWAGYIEAGQTFDMSGSVVDANLFDTNAKPVNHLSLVMAEGTSLAGVNMSDLWTRDLALDDQGSPVITFRGYANGDSNDSRHIYARWNGTGWTTSQVAVGGATFNSLDSNEQNGAGQGSPTGSTINSKLAVLDPNNPDIVYYSSQFDPHNNQQLVSTADGRPHFEMFKAVTPDGGATWTYEQLTFNSSVDNIRPTAAKTDDGTTVLLWMRGGHDKWDYTSNSWYAWDTAIVGLVTRPHEQRSDLTYLDANLSNTQLADGSAWSLNGNYTTGATTGPGSDDRWHLRTGFGNDGTLFTANEATPYDEDAPLLVTQITDPGAGTFDIFVHFWSLSEHPGEWRLQAALDTDNDGEHTDEQMVAFDRLGTQASLDSDFTTEVLVTESNRALYRGYLGRISIQDSQNISVFIDNLAATDIVPIPGINNPTTHYRTWYDGLSYARIIDPLSGDLDGDGLIDQNDLALVLAAWGKDASGSHGLADIDQDGVIALGELNTVLRNWTSNTAPVFSVPEPASLTLLFAGYLLLSRTTRRAIH